METETDRETEGQAGLEKQGGKDRNGDRVKWTLASFQQHRITSGQKGG